MCLVRCALMQEGTMERFVILCCTFATSPSALIAVTTCDCFRHPIERLEATINAITRS